MVAAALAQAIVPLIAWSMRPDLAAWIWHPAVLMLTGFFIGMWLLSAWLFRTSTHRGDAARR
jgi:hypothetical protein